MKNNPIYICYSLPLKKELIKNGEESLVNGLNPNTMRPFWVFMKSDKLNEILKNWSNGKKDDWTYQIVNQDELNGFEEY